MVGETTRVPMVLVDGGDDGLEETGWVEKIVSEDEALRLLSPLNTDPDLYGLAVDSSTTLRPDNPEYVPIDDQWWRPCAADDEHGVAFWVVRAVEREA